MHPFVLIFFFGIAPPAFGTFGLLFISCIVLLCNEAVDSSMVWIYGVAFASWVQNFGPSTAVGRVVLYSLMFRVSLGCRV